MSGRKGVLRRAMLLGALALGACQATEGAGLRRVAILDGAVTAAAPSGYCFAPKTGVRGEDTAVLLVGRCRAGTETEPAVLTYSFGGASTGLALRTDPEATAAYLRSDAARAALSRSGRGEDLKVVEIRDRDGAFLLRVQDREAGEYWRAMMEIRGRLVSISALPPKGAPLEAGKGLAIIGAAVDALVQANAAKG